MTNFSNHTIFITGASSGIGEACAKQFSQAGNHLILAARRIERLQDLATELQQKYSVKIHCLALDVRDDQAVKQALSQLPSDFNTIDVLINNAGCAQGMEPIDQGSTTDWDVMIDTNVKGLLYVTRAILPGMLERNQGHIINIGSTAGHEIYANGAVYCATKHAVKALTQGMKIDVHGTPIRVTSVDPGIVETEFSQVRFKGDKARAKKVYQGCTPLTPEDVADGVFYCASRPEHVNVRELILYATDQSTATMVARKN